MSGIILIFSIQDFVGNIYLVLPSLPAGFILGGTLMQDVWGVWFEGRNTPYVTSAVDRRRAVSNAKASRCAGSDRKVLGCRPLKGRDLILARRGDWVQTRLDGSNPTSSDPAVRKKASKYKSAYRLGPSRQSSP